MTTDRLRGTLTYERNEEIRATLDEIMASGDEFALFHYLRTRFNHTELLKRLGGVCDGVLPYAKGAGAQYEAWRFPFAIVCEITGPTGPLGTPPAPIGVTGPTGPHDEGG